tara:strand:- start:209 stop:367 length:159 start_codon:yes stop_codon:yes gene_type:complete
MKKAEKMRKSEAFKEVSGFEEPVHKSPHHNIYPINYDKISGKKSVNKMNRTP